MSYLQKLATMLGIGEHQAEDALHSERAARIAVGRRDFLAAGAALATGAAFSRFTPDPPGFWIRNPNPVQPPTIELGGFPLTWESIQLQIGDQTWLLGALPLIEAEGNSVRLAGPLGTTISVSKRAEVRKGDAISFYQGPNKLKRRRA